MCFKLFTTFICHTTILLGALYAQEGDSVGVPQGKFLKNLDMWVHALS